MALTHRTASVEIEQLSGSVANLLGGFFAGFAPTIRAEFVQRRVFGIRSRVARDDG